MDKQKIGVLGGGSWATALIKILTDNNENESICWYMRNKENVEHVKKFNRNKNYLSSVELNTKKLNVTNDILKVINNSEIIIIAIPSAFINEALKNVTNISNKYIFSSVKGVVPETNQIVADYLEDKFSVSPYNIGIIAGPCHAEEIALERLSYLTVASENNDLANYVANKFKVHYTKIKVSDDIYGTEYAAVLKNIFAVASGICHGLGYGDNFQAVLVSNAIREIKRFADTVHPITRDIKNSAYLGDLLVTSYSKFSRNRVFGTMIGKGYSIKTAQLEMNMIAEGYYAAKGIFEINKKYKIDMPITNAVYNILYENKNPAKEIEFLTSKLD